MLILKKNRLSSLGSSILAVVLLLCFIKGPALAAHPLITDDTGTQGKGKFLLELNGSLGFDKSNPPDDTGSATTKTREAEARATLTCGIIDTVDVIFGGPYQWKKTETGEDASSVSGIADISLEIKWRFFEKDGLSFAVKPGMSLPTGNKEKDLGTGSITGTFFLIATKETDPWAFDLNLGYKRNENKLDQRDDIWHASLACEFKAAKDLKLVANVGAESNTDKNSGTHPAFLLGGFIYTLRENLDIDFGVKKGLNETERDYAFLAGIALRF